MKTPSKLQVEGTDDLDEVADAEAVRISRVFMADLRNAYNTAARAGLEPDMIAGILLCHAYATLQLTFDLDKAGLAGMIGDSAVRYIGGGGFDANRENEKAGRMQ